MARVIVRDGRSEQVIELVDDVAIAGRAPENRIVLNERLCSRRQFQIERTPHGHKLVDLESRNGTRLNGRYVNGAILRPGDQIQVGNHIIVYEDPNVKEPPPDAPQQAASTAPIPIPQTTDPTDPAPPAAPPATSRPTPSQIRRHWRPRMNSGISSESKAVRTIAHAVVFLVILVTILIIANVLSRRPQGTTPSRTTKAPSTHADDTMEDLDYRKLRDFCERNSSDPDRHAEMARRCELFLRAYPSSHWSTQVQDYLETAHGGADGLRRSKVTRAETVARNALTRKEFSLALSTINETLDQYGSDLSAYDRLSALKNEILDAARDHFNAEHESAQALVQDGMRDEARARYEGVLLKMGDPSVTELEDIRRLVKEWLKTLN